MEVVRPDPVFRVWVQKKSIWRLEALVKDHLETGLGVPWAATPVDLKKGLPELPAVPLLVMGDRLFDAVKEFGSIPKNRSLGSFREQVLDLNGTKALVTFDPWVTATEPARIWDIVWGLKISARLATTGSLDPVPAKNYKFDKGFRHAIRACEKGMEARGYHRIAVDLETIGLDPWADNARIVSIQVSYEPGQADVYYVDKDGKLPMAVADHVRWLTSDKRIRVVGANLKFDKVWMKKHWDIEVTNDVFDTVLVGSLLDENRSNSLESHAKIYTGIGGYDRHLNQTYDKGRMDLVPPQELLVYAGGDTDACLQVANAQRKQLLKDKRLAKFYTRIVQPASRVFADMEYKGVLVDRDRYEELRVECSDEMEAHKAALWELMPNRMRFKYADNENPNRPKLMREFLFTKRGLNLKPLMTTEKSDEPSTAGDHLDLLLDAHPEHSVLAEYIQRMGRYNSSKKTLETFIIGFMHHIRSDGRFHPTYNMARGGTMDDPESGTVTGRLSVKDPAYQTIPSRTEWAKRLRSVYVAPDGYRIVKMDYSQGELRIAADMANEQTMIEAYRYATDIHVLTAAAVMGLTIEQFLQLDEKSQNEKRRAAKAINFGLIYGMYPAGLVNYARIAYGVHMSLAEGEAYREAYFEKYNGLPGWHADMKRTAKRKMYVRNPLGRIRRLPLIRSYDNTVRMRQERQAINSPVQSCLSDMMLMSIAWIHKMVPEVWMFGTTHDSLESYFPDSPFFDEMVMVVKTGMENLPLEQFGWNPKVPFVVDVEAAPAGGTLADTEKWEQS